MWLRIISCVCVVTTQKADDSELEDVPNCIGLISCDWKYQDLYIIYVRYKSSRTVHANKYIS